MNYRNNVAPRKPNRQQRRALRRRSNLSNRADRRKRKSEKIESKLRSTDRLIEELNGRTLERGVQDAQGNVFATNQQINDLQKRISELERELSRTKVEMQSVQKDVEELEKENIEDAEEEAVASEDMEEVMSKIGDGLLTAVQGFIGVVNAGDKVHNRAAQAAAEGLQTALTTDLLSEGQRTLAKAGVAVLKSLAYYDREKGFASLIGPDSASVIDATSTVVSASTDLGRLATALEAIQSALQTSGSGDALDLIAMSMGDLTSAIREEDGKNRNALVPAIQDLNAQVDHLTQKLPS